MKLTTEIRKKIDETRSLHEYITFLIINDQVHGGVVQNETQKFIMFFNFDSIREEKSKKRFLEMADKWWWESDQSEPIDVYFGHHFDEYFSVLRGYPKKTIQLHIGPTFSLADRYLKRIKKKKIEIINRTVLV